MIFGRFSKQEIRNNFTHTAWFCGIVPVYARNHDSPEPLLCERNWVPGWYFDLVSAVHQFAFNIVMALGGEPLGWKISRVREIKD